MVPLLLTRALIVHLQSSFERENVQSDSGKLLVHIGIECIDIDNTFLVDGIATFGRKTIIVTVRFLSIV